MTQPNFAQVSREELRGYMLELLDDEQAFHAYMDRQLPSLFWHVEPLGIYKTPIALLKSLRESKKIKQGRASGV